nr:dimethylaniline monooxygenase [N-oxide-forming] 2-like isoform X1 [Ciona intestinalis]|eukprot:XP_009858786.2 dimethylaniline monooxygenase [N-oxide-forming] 2-like isoform X1 [Ciona intestinalis]
MVKRVCVIGAGAAGLVSVKSCLDDGLEPVCYEFSSEIGGLWNNNERKRNNLSPKAYSTLITNVSKETSAFSDLPMPEEWPAYQTWQQYYQYFHLYADKFDLRRYIHFNVSVEEVVKSENYIETGSWVVQTRDVTTGKEKKEEFDAVIVASGRTGKQIWVTYPGLEDKFRGKVLHSGNYESAEEFKDKSVLVIGASNSGCDVAVDSSSYCKDVFISTRNGFWLVPRIFTHGKPLLMALSNRFKRGLQSFVPGWIINKVFIGMAEVRMNHEALGIRSKFGPMNPRATVTVSDELPLKIYSGLVKVRPEVKSFGEDHVTFVDGKTEAIDLIVMATGFAPKFEFLSKDIIPEQPEDMRLHKWIFPFNLEHPSTLTFVGSCMPVGSGPLNNTHELQARYVTQVLSGKTKLPSADRMQNMWSDQRKEMLKKTGGVFKFKVPIFEYQEEIAGEIGVLPSFFRLLFTDPRLAFNFYFGPLLPYHYRIVGENSKPECREYALNASARTWAAFR